MGWDEVGGVGQGTGWCVCVVVVVVVWCGGGWGVMGWDSSHKVGEDGVWLRRVRPPAACPPGGIEQAIAQKPKRGNPLPGPRPSAQQAGDDRVRRGGPRVDGTVGIGQDHVCRLRTLQKLSTRGGEGRVRYWNQIDD